MVTNASVLQSVTPDNARVLVSITKQRAYLLLGDQIAIDSPISSGKRGHTSPTGSFSILEKDKDHHSNIYGDYKDLDPQHPSIFAYTRSLGADKYLVVLNLSKDNVAYTLPEGLKAGQLALSNSDGKEENVTALNLKGWEARIYKL